MARLWSGNKFSSIVDDDKTPDISLTSSDDDNLKKMDFTRIKLDSDEDEMRMDYMHGSKNVDANNNVIEDVDDSDNEFMQNVQFAELQLGELQLSDNEAPQNMDDFLPNVYTVNFSDTDKGKEGNDSSDVSSYNPGNNIKFMSSIESEHQENEASIRTESGDEIKTESNHSSDVESPIRSIIESVNDNNDYESDFPSETQQSSPTRNSPPKSVTGEEFTPSYTQKSRNRNKRSKSKSSRHTRSESSNRTNSRSGAGDDTVSSTSSISSETHSKSSTPRKSYKRHHRHHTSKHNYTKQTNTAVQTDFIPNTNDILNFKYPWQQDKPHNIAANVVDGETLHVLTSYEPSVLAAHDMMKFHFKLLEQHISNSRRLYQAYSSQEESGKFKYTTVEDTMNFIEKNAPKVQTYEEVLRQMKKKGKKL